MTESPLHPATRLRSAASRHSALLTNAGALAAGTAATAVLGFAYWFVAARAFSPQAVGLAAAAVSMMNLLAQVGETGLGPFLMGQIPRRPGSAAALVSTALFATAFLCAATAAACLLGAFLMMPDFFAWAASPGRCLLFASGVAVTGVAIVTDQALVGFLRGTTAMWRGIAFATGKLVLLIASAAGAAAAEGEGILLTWIAGQAMALSGLWAFLAARRRVPWHAPRPSLLRPLAGDILGHHALNVALQAPGLALPFIVTVTLSAGTNAAFFAAWSLVNVALLVPASLATVVYSAGSGDPSLTASRMRLSLGVSTASGLVAGLGFLTLSPFILGLFNPEYPAIAGSSLQVLGFATLALAVKYHFVCVERLDGRMGRAAGILAAGGALELGAAVAGAQLGGLSGLTQGWLAAAGLQAVLMAPRVLAVAFPATDPAFLPREAT